MKKAKSKHAPWSTVEFDVSPAILEALKQMEALFPSCRNGRRHTESERPAAIAFGLVRIALANIEHVSPLFSGMIDYCGREGIDQTEYLDAQIALKFKRKLHKKSLQR